MNSTATGKSYEVKVGVLQIDYSLTYRCIEWNDSSNIYIVHSHPTLILYYFSEQS